MDEFTDNGDGTAFTSVQETDSACDEPGFPYTVPNYYFAWSSDNEAVATVDADGNVTYQSAGSATITALEFPDIYACQGPNPVDDGCNCPAVDPSPPVSDSKGVTVPVTPKIMRANQVITGTTQSVVVGQQVALTASFTLPSGVTVQSQSWSVSGASDNPPTVIADFNHTLTNGGPVALTNLSQLSTTFYWVTPGNSRQVTFTLHLSDGSTPSAQATFNVAAPSPAAPMVSLPTNGQLNINNLTGCDAQSGGAYLVFGNISGPAVGCPGVYTGQPGIAFSPPTTNTPQGTFFFLQVVNSDNVFYPSLTCNATPGLDGAYPYQNKMGEAVNDAPFAPLPYSTITRNFNATMHLMWQSNTQGSIAVPMGSDEWSFSSTATLSGGVWSTPTGGGIAGAFVPASGVSSIPTGTGLVVSASQNCH
jgi:hypothetical protein